MIGLLPAFERRWRAVHFFGSQSFQRCQQKMRRPLSFINCRKRSFTDRGILKIGFYTDHSIAHHESCVWRHCHWIVLEPDRSVVQFWRWKMRQLLILCLQCFYLGRRRKIRKQRELHKAGKFKRGFSRICSAPWFDKRPALCSFFKYRSISLIIIVDFVVVWN